MINNMPLLMDMLAKGTIRLRESQVLHESPKPLNATFSFEKVEGMLLGLAVGDALGATSEGQKPAERLKRYGEIRDYVPGKRSNFKKVGVPTDDTQLSFWTLEQLIEDRGLNPDHLAQKFCKHHIEGIGSTTKEFISNYKDRRVSWHKAGLDSLGNGSLMRIAPVILPYLRNPHPSLYADAALDTMITHNAYANVASCVAFVKMLWELLDMTEAPQPSWWIDEFCATVKDFEGNTRYHVRGGKYTNYEGPLWKFASEVCHDALAKGVTIRNACDSWGSGANLFETIPSVLYILATSGHSAEEAIIRAVNDTHDNDTVAAIVGAAVGALHGTVGIPQRWLIRLQGNIRKGGSRYQVFRLILLAKKVFWLQSKE